MLIVLSLILLLSATTVNAQLYYDPYSDVRGTPGMELRRGEQAPDSGAFFSGQAAISLLENLRDLQAYKGKLDALDNVLKAKDSQIGELESSKRSADIAIVKAEFIISNWELIDKSRREIVDEYRIALAAVRDTNAQLVQAVKSAESKSFWSQVWNTVLMTVVGAVAFAH